MVCLIERLSNIHAAEKSSRREIRGGRHRKARWHPASIFAIESSLTIEYGL
jgi:hypothetical protein